MRYIDLELSEVDIIQILNALSYFRNEIYWHESLAQKKKVGMYFNFLDNEEYTEQYNFLDNLHKRISLEANEKLYNKINEYFFEGQRIYLTNGKTYKQIFKTKYSDIKKYPNKYIKIFIKKSIDKFKKIV